MEYMPLVKSMNRVASGPLGDKHTVILFDKIESAGAVQYAFILGVFDNQTQEPAYFLASEVNQTVASFGGGSHFLGAFDGTGHANLGSSDDWGDLRKFFVRAVQLAAERFDVKLDPSLFRPPAKGGETG